MQAELYAGLIYERNGGVFQMYDILSESNFAWDKDDVEDMEIDDVVSKLENAGAALANAGNKLLALSEKDIDAATASDDGFAIIARALKQISGDYNLQQLITTSASESTESDSDEDEEDEDDYETRYHDQTTWRSGTDWDDHRER